MSWLQKWLCKLLKCCAAETPKLPPWQLRLWFPENPSFFFQGDNLMSGILNPGQRIAFSVDSRDRHGNPAVIDGAVVATCDDGRVTTTINEDGKSGYFHLGSDATFDDGMPVAATATVEFDSRMGDDVNTITLTGALLLGPAEATQANSVLTFGDAEDEPSGGETG